MNGGRKAWGIPHLPFSVSSQWWFSVTGTVSGAPLSFQSGISSLSDTGSTTAPDRMCAPTSLPFSRTQTETSRPPAFARCLRRMAADRPAGPAPTTTTSYCIDSRSLIVLSSRPNHHSTHLHCPFLDHGVNGSEEGRVGGNLDEIGIAEARSAMAWWLEAGVDVAVQEEARDWLKP